VILVPVGLLGDGSEVRVINIVLATNLLWSKSQVRSGKTASLEGVIIEVSLSIQISVVGNDLDSILVGTNSSIGSLSEKDALDCALWDEGELILAWEGLVGNVVVDGADEVIYWGLGCKVFEDSDYVSWDEVLGRLSITSANDCINSLNTTSFN
jgi:hypothetical protein